MCTSRAHFKYFLQVMPSQNNLNHGGYCILWLSHWHAYVALSLAMPWPTFLHLLTFSYWISNPIVRYRSGIEYFKRLHEKLTGQIQDSKYSSILLLASDIDSGHLRNCLGTTARLELLHMIHQWRQPEAYLNSTQNGRAEAGVAASWTFSEIGRIDLNVQC